jgi:hypothetical protein
MMADLIFVPDVNDLSQETPFHVNIFKSIIASN